MSQRSRFFDSVGSDRVYTSAAWAEVATGLISNGVVYAGTGTELSVVEDSPAAMSVEVNLGKAFVLGYFFEVYSAAETLSIAAADPTNPRIDRVVIRRDLSARTTTLAVLTGTPAGSPTPPALTQSAGGTWEESLAQVAVAALASSIVNANITDERTYATSPWADKLFDATDGHTHSGVSGDGKVIPFENIPNIASDIEFTTDNTYSLGTDSVRAAAVHTNSLAVGGVQMDFGTAFPGSPATGDRCFRTNIGSGTWFVYDGTRWVSEDTIYWSGDMSSLTRMMAIYGSLDLWFMDYNLFYTTTGTNDGSNYWSFVVRFTDSTGTTFDPISLGDTSADSTSTSYATSGSINTLIDVSAGGTGGYKQMLMTEKVGAGSPSNLDDEVFLIRFKFVEP